MFALRKTWWIIFIAIFLCFFRLKDTYLLIQDTARDSVRMIEIFQNKELTLIGPPASLGQRSEREFYLGSFSYYFGILGLALSGFSAEGASLFAAFVFIFSIPYFYLLTSKRLNLKNPLLATFMYATSPLIINQVRFYWNPNAIIGLATLFWFLTTNDDKNKKLPFILAGLIAGIIFNLHYLAILPIAIWYGCLLLRRQFKPLFFQTIGTFVTISPTLIFELRNHFFLSQTFLYNLSHKPTNTFTISNFLTNLTSLPNAIAGIKPAEISFATLPINPNLGLLIAAIFIIGALVTNLRSKHNQFWLTITTTLSLLLLTYISGPSFYSRYAFVIVPIFIILLAGFLNRFKLLSLLILVPVAYANFSILTFTPNPNQNYLPLSSIQRASLLIKHNNPQGKYNLSENIYGDAQARGLRYYVLKDLANKPQNEISYGFLDSLYVLSPSLEKIISDNRYEFYAPNLKTLVWQMDLGQVSLFKFIK